MESRDRELAQRLRQLPTETILGREVRVAATRRSRLLGLALLRRSRAGDGLLIPRCRSVHSFGMRFRLDLAFLGECGEIVAVRRHVGPRRVVSCRGAHCVLELPAEGGELFGSAASTG